MIDYKEFGEYLVSRVHQLFIQGVLRLHGFVSLKKPRKWRLAVFLTYLPSGTLVHKPI